MTSLYDLSVSNQVLLERLKADQDKVFSPYLQEIDRLVRLRLSEEGGIIETKRALDAIIRDINAGQLDIYDRYTNEFIVFLEELAVDQSEFEVESIAENVTVSIAIPDQDPVLSALRNGVMSVENYNGKPLLLPFIKDFTDKQIQLVNTAIQQGYSQGQTVDQITRRIRGSKANKFRDGDLARVDRSNRAMVHTTMQHASSMGRESVWRKNKDIINKYQWLSTLDSRTTNVCRSLDLREFVIGKGPLPPIHVNCRSTTVPVVDKRFSLLADEEGDRPSVGAQGAQVVGGDETYYQWLKRQPASFQDAAIGPTRAKLLRDGGIGSEEFAKLNLNKNFEPLTLAEMRRIRPDIFTNAGI
jgi:SPP1 gp7 family putative phage head morphogenesis protein